MSILVWIEQMEGRAVSSCWEVLGKSKALAEQLGSSAMALVIGDNVEPLAQEALAYGASTVYLASAPVLARYRLKPYADLLEQAIDAAHASVILTSATNHGRTLAATVACRRSAGIASNASDLRVEGNQLVAERAIYSGNILADVQFESELKFASIRPRSFPMPEAEAGAGGGEVIRLDVSVEEGQVREKITDYRSADTGEVSLTDARIIVSGGRGVAADPEKGFQLVAELADVLGAAMGASRAAVDAGYVPYKHQVGQTGKSVKPDLYIAAGISGAIQHLAGMGESKLIVAINKDDSAAIFERAHYGVVDDLFTMLPALSAEFRKRLGE
jgi:electron transfer flavoprotein alpha subunit